MGVCITMGAPTPKIPLGLSSCSRRARRRQGVQNAPRASPFFVRRLCPQPVVIVASASVQSSANAIIARPDSAACVLERVPPTELCGVAAARISLRVHPPPVTLGGCPLHFRLCLSPLSRSLGTLPSSLFRRLTSPPLRPLRVDDADGVDLPSLPLAAPSPLPAGDGRDDSLYPPPGENDGGDALETLSSAFSTPNS